MDILKAVCLAIVLFGLSRAQLGPIPPEKFIEFEECLQMKDTTFDNVRNGVKTCFVTYSSSIAGEQALRELRVNEIIEKTCTLNMNPLSCVNQAKDIVYDCLDDIMKKGLNGLLSSFHAALDFVCQDGGKRAANVFSTVDNVNCFAFEFQNLSSECHLKRKNLHKLIEYSELFGEFHCKEEYEIQRCLISRLNQRCDKSVVDLMYEITEEMSRASACKEHIYNNAATFSFSHVLLPVCLLLLFR